MQKNIALPQPLWWLGCLGLMSFVWLAKPSTDSKLSKVNTAKSLHLGYQEKVPYQDLLRMTAKYRDQRQEIINDTFAGTGNGKYGNGFADSRYFTLELQKLKDFIYYVEDQVKENNLDINFDGIRVYPVVYPATGSTGYFSSVPQEYRNHLSVVLVPTYLNTIGETIDFDPDLYLPSNNGAKNKPKSLFKPSNMTEDDFMDWLFGENDTIRAVTVMNHGGLCPPPSNCTTSSLLLNTDELCPDYSACPY